MIGIDSLSSACPMGPSRMRLRPSPSVMVCRSRLRSAVGQQHELATSAAGKADVERLAPVFEDEGLRDVDREAPLGSKSAELAELVPPQQIGRASCRERVCPYVYISVLAVSLKKNITQNYISLTIHCN